MKKKIRYDNLMTLKNGLKPIGGNVRDDKKKQKALIISVIRTDN